MVPLTCPEPRCKDLFLQQWSYKRSPFTDDPRTNYQTLISLAYIPFLAMAEVSIYITEIDLTAIGKTVLAARFDALTVVTVTITVFCDETPCSLADRHQHILPPSSKWMNSLLA